MSALWRAHPRLVLALSSVGLLVGFVIGRVIALAPWHLVEVGR